MRSTSVASLCHCHVFQTSIIPSPPLSSIHDGSVKFHGNALRCRIRSLKRSQKVLFALAESDSPNKSLEPIARVLLQELADSFDLPPDYFAKLPRDLRLDLNDAAFDLSNGPIVDQCGQELGETMLDLSRAWESADTTLSCTLVRKFPSLEDSLNGSQKSALGRRLVSAGRRFQAMGQYGQGELAKGLMSWTFPVSWDKGISLFYLNITLIYTAYGVWIVEIYPRYKISGVKIAKSMIAAGKLLSESTASTDSTNQQPKNETRAFKFGELQVQVTPENANIGAAIAFVFGILSWQVSQGIQSIPESSMEYANDNALMLAKSLRGALLGVFYASTVLSAFSTVGLLLLARQLSSNKDN